MAKTPRKSPDRFRVGQAAAFVFDKQTGHQRHNGKLTVVLAARIYGEWTCSDPDHPERGTSVQNGWRYKVRSPEGPMRTPINVEECMLRPIYDGEPLSTWEKFEKSTGINLRGELVPIKRTRRPKSTA